MTVLREKLYLYVLSPIDDWMGWTHERDFIAEDHHDGDAMMKYFDLKWRAFNAARETDWEGDVRDGPFVSGLPGRDPQDPELIIGWKEDSNGTSYVGSFVPLPWCQVTAVKPGERAEGIDLLLVSP